MPADKILISQAQIESRLPELAAEINGALPDGPVHVVMILKGAVIFGVDLARALERNTTLGFLTAYKSTCPSITTHLKSSSLLLPLV